ncbi:MAG: homoserine kinase [Candidatus Acidiferrales bacterium]
MPVIVHIPTALQKFTSGAQSVEMAATSLPSLLDEIAARFPEISHHLRDDTGELRRFLNIYVNDEHIRFLGGAAYQFRDGDDVLLVPSIAGGAMAEPVCITASAPASSANLGCAFDCAALALNLRLRARASLRHEQGFVVDYTGPNPERVPLDESNLVVVGIVRCAAAHGAEIAGVDLKIASEIPVGVGFGSSAAATVCGLFLGTALLGVEPDLEEILALAADIEGHPDNAAAACRGGLVFAAREEESGRVLCARTMLSAHLRLVAIVPPTAISTPAARAVLPREYSRADVVHNMQRASLLAAICCSGAGQIEPELFRDRLHQPYRVPLVPGLAECLAVRHPDLLGVCLSGSGSAALAFTCGSEEEIGRLLAAPFAALGVAPTVLVLQPEPRGAQIETSRDAQIALAEIECAARGAAVPEAERCRS